MESSNLQLRQKEPLLDIDVRGTAEYAARLAYDSFTQKNLDCNLAIAAFDNYAHITSDKMAEEMQYLYGEIYSTAAKLRKHPKYSPG